MIVVAVFSTKGGVGKTATALNVADAAARQGERVLLWDLDPQGTSTYLLRVKPKVAGGLGPLLTRRGSLAEHVRGTDVAGLDLLPSDPSYSYADLALDALRRPRRGIRRALKPGRELYDVAFLDCPPSLSLLSESILRASHALLVPVTPSSLALPILERIDEHAARRGRHGLRVLPFFSMVDRRKGLHRTVVAELPRVRPDFLTTSIPYASVVERCALERAPVAVFVPASPVVERYRAL